MKVQCEHCRARFDIPDSKIPENKTVSLKCPKCKKGIMLKPRITGGQNPSRVGKGAGTNALSGSENAEKTYGYDDYSDEEDIEYFEEGLKLALVLTENPDYSEKIRNAVEESGYRFIHSMNVRDAIGKMRFHHFDLILLAEGFGGQDLRTSPIIGHLNRQSMAVRRRIFLGLLSDEFKTFDHMMAFALSANAVINTKDTDKFSAILKKAILDNEKFYKVYTDALVELGKA